MDNGSSTEAQAYNELRVKYANSKPTEQDCYDYLFGMGYGHGVSAKVAQYYTGKNSQKTITYSYLTELKARLVLYFEITSDKSNQDQNDRDIHAIKHVLSLLDRIK